MMRHSLFPHPNQRRLWTQTKLSGRRHWLIFFWLLPCQRTHFCLSLLRAFMNSCSRATGFPIFRLCQQANLARDTLMRRQPLWRSSPCIASIERFLLRGKYGTNQSITIKTKRYYCMYKARVITVVLVQLSPIILLQIRGCMSTGTLKNGIELKQSVVMLRLPYRRMKGGEVCRVPLPLGYSTISYLQGCGNFVRIDNSSS